MKTKKKQKIYLLFNKIINQDLLVVVDMVNVKFIVICVMVSLNVYIKLKSIVVDFASLNVDIIFLK